MGQYEDEMARLRAELDQAREGLRELAAALWTLYRELTQQGFTHRQAFELTATWLVEMVNARGDHDE